MTNRTVLVRLRADVSDFVAKSQLAKAAVGDLNDSIDKSNDRTAWLAQGILAVAPAVTTLGAAAVPVLSGMATQMMLTVAAAGTMALAFNGVGDALGALNDYQLDPSAANLEKLEQAMEKIGPAGEELVRFLDSLSPALATLANTARGEMFPGIISGIEELMELAPQLTNIVGEISAAIGDLAAEGGAGLSSERFEAFFNYLETDARPILTDMGRTLGNFTLGLANMMVEFDPLTTSFSSGLLEMSRSFASWSESFGSSQGFQQFLEYVQDAGPKALDFFGSLVMALVELAEAAAPVGAVMLPFLTSLLDVIGDLANTPLGPLAVGFLALTSAWGRLNALASITGSGVMAKATEGIKGNVKAAREATPTIGAFGTALNRAGQGAENQSAKTKAAMGSMREFGKAAAPVAGQLGLLAFALSDYDDKLGLANTSTLALAGSMLGLPGLIGGALVGAFLDIQAAGDAATSTIENLSASAVTDTPAQFAEKLKQANAELEQFKMNDVNYMADKLANVFGGTSQIDEKTNAIKEAEEAARKAAAEVARLDAEQAKAARGAAYEAAMKRAEDAVMDFAEAVARVDALLSKRSSLRDYEAAVDDFAESIRKNGNSFDISTEKGRNNQAMLDGIAGTAIRVAENMKGAAKQKFLTSAIRDLETMGSKFDVPKSEIETLIERLRAANKADVKPVIKVDALPAFATFRQIDQAMSALDGKTATTYVITRRINTGDTQMGPRNQAADGATVPDSGLGYADRFLYLLADKEEVISNRRGQADKYRPALKAINADMPPSVIKGMLAGGGTAGRKKRRSGVEFDSEVDFSPSEIAQQQAAEAQAQYYAEQERIQREAEERARQEHEARMDAEEAAEKAAEEAREAEAEAARQREAAIAGQEEAAKQLISAAEAQKASAEAVLEGWNQAMSRVGTSATAGFRSSGFDGEQQRGLWATGTGTGGAAGWRGSIEGDIKGLEERARLIPILSGLGIKGKALENLLAEATNEEINQLINSGEAVAYADTFNRREALLENVAGSAGQAAYGAEAANAAAAVAALGERILALQGELAAISAQRPINIYEAISAQATAAEVERLTAIYGA